jgi:hypothetical protein
MRDGIRDSVPGVEQIIDLAVRIFWIRGLVRQAAIECGDEALVLMGEKSLQ